MDRSDPDGSDSNSNSTSKTRRSHKKSRNGCEKCKARRIKCDELKPKCSRCTKLGLVCRYPTRNRITQPEESKEVDSLELQTPQKSFLAALSRQQLFNLLVYDQTIPIWHPHPVQTLTPPESALLEHYLSHTSKDMTVDDGDQYALQIGIPNLAFQSKPLMRSVLAFSAICKCHDIIKHSPVSSLGRSEILDLLRTADKYHMESLREIQPTLSKVKQYDHILANAAMMGMYGSGSHCVRIWLTETAEPMGNALDGAPKSGQWISLFRAARLAYGGLIKQTSVREEDGPEGPVSSASESERMRPLDHPLYTVIAATVSSAMTKLDEKVDMVRGIVGQSCEVASPISQSGIHVDLEACLCAFDLLREIVTETLSKHSTCALDRRSRCETDFNTSELGTAISPWMRRYTANITSMVPSKLPRRFIMAFVHKAPTRYLELVERMMNSIQDGSGINHCFDIEIPEPDLAHQLAMEIFAHWLVLVLLLDNVWWIGGIGSWELQHVVTAKRNMWRGSLWEDSEDWWPQSMLEINRQLSKYREGTR